VLAGAIDLADAAAARAVQWIPPHWDWVDPLKDIQAQVLAMEAGITSRRKVVEATGYDIEEVDRENAADMTRATALGLGYPASSGTTQGARATPPSRPNADTAEGTAAAEQSEQE
jgi:capsid protein